MTCKYFYAVGCSAADQVPSGTFYFPSSISEDEKDVIIHHTSYINRVLSSYISISLTHSLYHLSSIIHTIHLYRRTNTMPVTQFSFPEKYTHLNGFGSYNE